MEISVAAASDTSTCTTGSLYWTHPRLRGALFTRGAGAIPLRLWIRTVTAAIPTRFSSKMAHIAVSAQWLRTQCDRAPENWRFECPPTLETECAPMWESNNKHRANTTQSNSESVSVEICRTPRGTNNSGRGRPIMTEDRSTGG